MITDGELRDLSRWQRGLFAAGCATRVSPIVDAFGTNRERWTWHRLQSAMTDGLGQLDDVTVGNLKREFVAAQRENRLAVPPAVLLDAFGTVESALAACLADPERSFGGARYASYGAAELFEALGRRWWDLEVAAQRRSFDLVRALTPERARPAVTAVGLPDDELAVLIAQIGADQGLTVAPPLPPPPVPRQRHVGHTRVELPRQEPTTIVRADDRTWTDGTAYRSGDVLRMSCPAADATVQGVVDEGVLALAPSWPAPFESWSLAVDTTDGIVESTPDAATLAVGDTCRIAIRAKTVYAVRAFVVVPRRGTVEHAVLVARPAGQRPLGGFADYVAVFEPYALPIELVLLHRSYRFLEREDRVSDADGVELLFRPPFLFLTPEAEAAVPGSLDWPASWVPRWPLALRIRDGRTPKSDEVDAVATATATGCHDDELDAWEHHAEVALPGENDLVPWFLDVAPRRPTYRPM